MPVSPAPPVRRWGDLVRFSPLIIGIAALVIPTLFGISEVSWATEQGAHGPIVLAIGIWLVARRWPAIISQGVPGRGLIGWPLLIATLIGYWVARIVGSIVIESAMLYLALVTALYLFVGLRAIRASWFPIAYLLFVLPPPGSWVATATQPLRLEISQYAVNFLALLGYPVARSGLIIYIDQYLIEVKAACGGLNSIISLTAIGLFYAYIRYNANVRYTAVLFFVIVFMAVVANFVRVVALILITHYFGNGAAQGFLHEFTGLTMFTVAMGGMFLFDMLAAPLRRALSPGTEV